MVDSVFKDGIVIYLVFQLHGFEPFRENALVNCTGYYWSQLRTLALLFC